MEKHLIARFATGEFIDEELFYWFKELGLSSKEIELIDKDKEVWTEKNKEDKNHPYYLYCNNRAFNLFREKGLVKSI